MQLPLSGLSVRFGEPDGEVEATIVERFSGRTAASGVALLSSVARTADGAPLNAAALALTDFEAALAGLRIHLSGPEVAAQADCRRCAEPVELVFSLAALAAAASPRTVAGAILTDGTGEIDGHRFRLPTAADLCACEGTADAEERLWRRCVDTPVAPLPRRRMERAMARIAPLLSRIISATCPGCGGALRVLLHVPTLVIGELAWSAARVFEDVHLIAAAYGWREPEILALRSSRRRRYATTIRATSRAEN